MTDLPLPGVLACGPARCTADDLAAWREDDTLWGPDCSPDVEAARQRAAWDILRARARADQILERLPRRGDDEEDAS